MLHDEVAILRQKRLNTGKLAVPDFLQGVSKARVKEVLDGLALGNKPDLVDAVFALLDNETDSWFKTAPKGTKFSDGASTAHIGCHVGVLQRGRSKLDREGRDYWIKPMQDLGGIEPITLINSVFVAGHPKAKSSNSAYRLNSNFKKILQAKHAQWRKKLAIWSSKNAVRQRRTYQARVQDETRKQIDSGHSQLIKAAVTHYAERFLSGYEVIYIDDGDSSTYKEKLAQAGISLTLADANPDVLLWNKRTNSLWVLEAVTSDGEADFHKVQQLKRLADRHGKKAIGFTTVYRNWRDAATRQEPNKNLAVNTYMWIQSDPAKQFLVTSFE